jgi:acetyltransferase-like isoleucine patch superfamily enzyme
MEPPFTSSISRLLGRIRRLLDDGPDIRGTGEILGLLGLPCLDEVLLSEIRLYSEYLPKAAEYPFTSAQRNLHHLWDAFDRSPLSLAVNFAFPFRRTIAERLLSRCGRNFIADGNVRFNFGQFITVGDDVFFNQGVFIDSKGGVTLGNAVGIAEFVRIFTHTHSESVHSERTYGPVAIGDYAKIYSGAMIFPGVTIGDQAIVAGGAVVTRDVPPNMVVAGVPARVIRERRSGGHRKEALDHRWFHGGAFQDG